MKENDVNSTPMDAMLRERLLLSRAVPGDRLMLADATLLAALDGSRVLTPNERAALRQSPLTLRRFRQLALTRRAGESPAAQATTTVIAASAAATAAAAAAESAAVSPGMARAAGHLPSALAANDARWLGSGGMLRAAASAIAPEQMTTDDNCWTLHFLAESDSWQVILKIAAEAPFAARLLREQTMLRVVDGGGAIVLQGRLDADGECECAWPFAIAPGPHFQLYGATFAVEPMAP